MFEYFNAFSFIYFSNKPRPVIINSNLFDVLDIKFSTKSITPLGLSKLPEYKILTELLLPKTVSISLSTLNVLSMFDFIWFYNHCVLCIFFEALYSLNNFSCQ